MKRPPLPLLFLFVQPAFADGDALTQCRHIEDTAERVLCYDQFVDARLATASSDSAETGSPLEPAGSMTVPDARSLFGTNDAEAKRIVETTLAIEQIDQIEAIVTDVRESASRKLIVTLDNGQTWRQLDNKRLHLKGGETVVVRKASLGSFLLEKRSGSLSIRVKRAN